MGTYQTLSPLKDNNVVRKVPVSVGNGFVINDRQVSQHDTLDCSRACLSIISFKFHDAFGQHYKFTWLSCELFHCVFKHKRRSVEFHKKNSR